MVESPCSPDEWMDTSKLTMSKSSALAWLGLTFIRMLPKWEMEVALHVRSIEIYIQMYFQSSTVVQVVTWNNSIIAN